MNKRPVLEMKGISKRFAGIQALDNVDFNAYAGEINILIGENGAGKSTLMRILAGAHTADEGVVLINGEEKKISTPAEAINEEIVMIYQELNLIYEMTVTENMYLGHELLKGGMIDKRKQQENVKKLLEELDFDIDPTAKIEELSAAKRQMVEIAKAIHLNAKVIIMDEPTSSLADNEVQVLFRVMRQLKEQGVCIIFISHRMDEIFEVGDRITILRDGNLVGEWFVKDLTREDVISHMVGRQVTTLFDKESVPIGKTVLEVKNLSKYGLFEDVSFCVRAGEILGFAGLMGAGRSEVMKSVFGDIPCDEGEIFIDGQAVTIKNPAEAMRLGIGFVPEDRKNLGLNMLDTVGSNLTLTILKEFAKGGFIRFAELKKKGKEMVDKLRIKVSGLEQPVATLSGGNQQKVVIGKWLQRKAKVMILDEPTRGVDVGAKAEIHRLIVEMAKSGVAVIVVSSELPEILGMADRVVVMCEGHASGELSREEMSQEAIMRLATAN
mgnify:CR=1 FL=1